MSFAKTETAKRAIASGMAPHRAKKAEHDAKWAAKQAKEFIGFSDMLPSGKDSWYEKIDYSEDRTIDMPMLMTQLKIRRVLTWIIFVVLNRREKLMLAMKLMKKI